MRVLILSHAQYITIGLPKIIEFAESLVELGHEVSLCVTSKDKRWGIVRHVKNGVQIIECPSLLFGGLRHGVDFFDALNRIWALKEEKFDIVHCVASRPTVFYPGIFLKKKNRVKVLIYEWEDSFAHGGVALERRGKTYYRLFGGIEKYFEEAILKHADGVIVVSDFLAQRAMELGVVKQSILHQIKGTKLIEQEFPEKEIARRKLGYRNTDNEIVFTYVGAIYESDLSLLLASFDAIAKLYSRVKLILVGYNRKLPDHIPPNVTILPRVPDKQYHLQLAMTDVFVLPLDNSIANISRYPSKFGDYLAVGRPVVATPHPEIGRMIRCGKCGYVADNASVSSFSSALIKALDDQGRWPMFSENARNYALRNLSWDSIGRRVVAYYESILTQKTQFS